MQEDKIKEIRGKLRRFMNGVVSDSMRRQGIIYKLNFGVSLPQLKQIAAEYTPDKELAEELWEHDVRELKLLSVMLYPKEELTYEKASEWIQHITHAEIAEQLPLQLLQYSSEAEKLAVNSIVDTKDFPQMIGFQLFSRLFARNQEIATENVNLFLTKSKELLDKGVSRPQRAALNALKRYGKQNKCQAEQVLSLIADYPESGCAEKEEFYNDLKFEFEYSL